MECNTVCLHGRLIFLVCYTMLKRNYCCGVWYTMFARGLIFLVCYTMLKRN